MKAKKRKNGKLSAIVMLSVLLVLTIVVGVIGVTGLPLDSRGLYRLAGWLPTTNADNWPSVLSLGLDLRGGVYVEYSATVPGETEASFDSLVEGTISVIQARLTDKGYTEANVQRIGTDGIRVEIPDTDDPQAVLDLIGTPAKLEFLDPDGNVFMDGSMVKTASYYYAEGDHQVAFELTDEGAKVFAQVTASSIGQVIAIHLDGEVLIAPTVENAITGGSGVINNMGDAETATNIAAQIQSGALPLDLTQQKEFIYQIQNGEQTRTVTQTLIDGQLGQVQSFEDPAEDCGNWISCFGKNSGEHSTQQAQEGSGSMKIVMNPNAEDALPFFALTKDSQLVGGSWKGIQTVKMYLYNPAEETINLSVSYYTNKDVNMNSFELLPGQWTLVELTMPVGALEDIDAIEEIDFNFERGTAVTVYLDSLVTVKEAQ